jgi:hypothetical protein
MPRMVTHPTAPRAGFDNGVVDLTAGTAQQYADFALDARDYSPCFDDWATRVAADAEVLAWLERLPTAKRQPNLVFAAARWHGVPAPGPYDGLRSALLGDDGTIVATILARSTQTNEVGRLATLVPAFVLAAGPGPIGLIEVGASAGLNLFPDRYRYTWRTASGERRAGDPAAPELGCRVIGDAPLPAAPPVVAWRGGIDLLRGDLLEELPAMVDRAAAAGPVLVFHSAVIAYLEPEDADRFHDLMAGLVANGRCHWVSNEAPNVLPRVTAAADVPDARGFVLGVDGRAVAVTQGHGRWLRWL